MEVSLIVGGAVWHTTTLSDNEKDVLAALLEDYFENVASDFYSYRVRYASDGSGWRIYLLECGDEVFSIPWRRFTPDDVDNLVEEYIEAEGGATYRVNE